MRYIVITKKEVGELQGVVNERLKEGWELQGGTSSISDGNGMLQSIKYCQAMIYKELKG